MLLYLSWQRHAHSIFSSLTNEWKLWCFINENFYMNASTKIHSLLMYLYFKLSTKKKVLQIQNTDKNEV